MIFTLRPASHARPDLICQPFTTNCLKHQAACSSPRTPYTWWFISSSLFFFFFSFFSPPSQWQQFLCLTSPLHASTWPRAWRIRRQLFPHWDDSARLHKSISNSHNMAAGQQKILSVLLVGKKKKILREKHVRQQPTEEVFECFPSPVSRTTGDSITNKCTRTNILEVWTEKYWNTWSLVRILKSPFTLQCRWRQMVSAPLSVPQLTPPPQPGEY